MFRVALEHLPAQVTHVVLGVPNDRSGWVEDVLQKFPLPGNVSYVVDAAIGATRDQVDTLTRMLTFHELAHEPILCRDGDSQFAMPEYPASPGCSIAVADAARYPTVALANKCFVLPGPVPGVAGGLVEKRVVSPLFGVGAYGFSSGEEFLASAAMLRRSTEEDLYVSHLLRLLMGTGLPVRYHLVQKYEDYGTLTEWRACYAAHGTLFCDIDGVLLSYTGAATRASATPLARNISALQGLPKGWMIVLTTARAESERAELLAQIARHRIPFDMLLMGLPRGPRVVVNDSAASNAGQTARALTLPRDSDTLPELLDV
jgi:hypothetical protein